MTNRSLANFAPAELLQCPTCESSIDNGLDPQTLICVTCNARYFTLGDVPCLFPGGEHHLAIWRHQAGVMQAQGQQGLAQVQEAASRYDLLEQSRDRLVRHFAAMQSSQAMTLALLANAGIEPKMDEQLAQMDAGDLAEYYDLILRDWAWQTGENADALQRILDVQPENVRPQRILVLGAGAGRLSWDLHCALRPEFTVALDSNPLLLTVADTLIHQRQAIELAEFKVFPQVDKEVTREWDIQAPEDPERLRDSWFALGANAWRAPLRAQSFDLVVTPWFIDVNGGDVRDTIAVVDRLLVPGGRWVNSGPLLFTRHLPLEVKYQASEIKEFLKLSAFDLEAESVDEADHLDSPLEVRKQHEQLWTFCARRSDAAGAAEFVPGGETPWLIMHHLKIPQHPYATAQAHPLIDAILALIDGSRSINDITAQIAPQIPEGISPKDAVVTLLGQILNEMAEQAE